MKKNTIKKLITLTAAFALAVGLTGCNKPADPSKPAPSPSAPVASDTLKVGIIQYAPHASLDNCSQGFIQGLSDGGYTDGKEIVIDMQNAQGESANADMMAKNMVAAGYDLIVGVATPAAMSAYAAVRETDIPMVFTAVSDPVAAGIVKTMDAPDSGATGTSDALNHDGQLKMIRALLPDAKTIGILYTTSEPNSTSNLAAFTALASHYGFEVVPVGITNASEVATGAATLVAKKVDCVNNFTDNNVVNQLSTLLKTTGDAGIPVFGSEVEQVKNGCVASESLDYVALGAKTGKMAADILKGTADVKTSAVEVIVDSQPVYSAANCEKFGITIPADYVGAENVDE